MRKILIGKQHFRIYIKIQNTSVIALPRVNDKTIRMSFPEREMSLSVLFLTYSLLNVKKTKNVPVFPAIFSELCLGSSYQNTLMDQLFIQRLYGPKQEQKY